MGDAKNAQPEGSDFSEWDSPTAVAALFNKLMSTEKKKSVSFDLEPCRQNLTPLFDANKKEEEEQLKQSVSELVKMGDNNIDQPRASDFFEWESPTVGVLYDGFLVSSEKKKKKRSEPIIIGLEPCRKNLMPLFDVHKKDEEEQRMQNDLFDTISDDKNVQTVALDSSVKDPRSVELGYDDFLMSTEKKKKSSLGQLKLEPWRRDLTPLFNTYEKEMDDQEIHDAMIQFANVYGDLVSKPEEPSKSFDAHFTQKAKNNDLYTFQQLADADTPTYTSYSPEEFFALWKKKEENDMLKKMAHCDIQ